MVGVTLDEQYEAIITAGQSALDRPRPAAVVGGAS